MIKLLSLSLYLFLVLDQCPWSLVLRLHSSFGHPVCDVKTFLQRCSIHTENLRFSANASQNHPSPLSSQVLKMTVTSNPDCFSGFPVAAVVTS